jgi:hypothetical protein
LNEGLPLSDSDSMMPPRMQRRNAREAFGLLDLAREAVGD